LYRINSITPKGGEAIELAGLTVLVGPNNCGKSQTLKDVRHYTTSGSQERLVVLKTIDVVIPTKDEFKARVNIRPNDNAVNQINVTGVKDDLMGQMSFGAGASWFEDVFSSGVVQPQNRQQILQHLGPCLIAYLGAEARFKLTESSAAFNPRSESPSNALQSLFAADSSVLAELRRVFQAAFEMDIGVDWAAMTKLYLRVAKNFGEIPDEKGALDALMAEADELQKQGDGFRSFSGIALALLTYPTRTFLLDEPEAFLHPTQARVLGRWLAGQASSRTAQIIVATHSADFLAGLVGASEDPTILRLNREGVATRFHRIPKGVTIDLVESPLLSSQPVLDSLFHRGVVICEGDPDRAVYQTVAQHFVDNKRGEDFLFIHSNGKDAAKLPAKLLRESGTPVCVVADFDLLNSEQTLDEIVEGITGIRLDEATKTLRADVAAAVETKSQEQSLKELKANVTKWQEQSGCDLRRAKRSLVSFARAGSNKWEQAKKSGLACLPEGERKLAVELISKLASLGVFIVPCGELESWMGLGLPKGNKWNQQALQTLHNNECPSALKEFVGDVLAFLTPLPQHGAPGG